ncbi:MAG: LPS assembly lipoprotein LptE, partial [Elusimicrobiota bacterium]|nr:LPS assembly lipoprotein LptE [Elusimicrobiota bacterium]
MKNFKIKFWVLSLAALVAAGCGVYEPIGIIPDEIRNIRIEQFENKTSQTDIAEDLTEEVIDNFIKEGRLSVVSRHDADSRL